MIKYCRDIFNAAKKMFSTICIFMLKLIAVEHSCL